MKRNITLLVAVLLLSLPFNGVKAKSSANSFAQGACIAAGVLGVAAGLATLADWCFSETNQQLVVRGEREYNNACQYTERVEFFENVYDISGLTNYDKNYVLTTMREPLLFTIANSLSERGIASAYYCTEVVASAKQLKQLSDRLHERINGSVGVRLNHEEIKTMRSMHALVARVDGYLPHLQLYADYLASHASYFNLFDKEANIRKHYQEELRLVQMGMHASVAIHHMKQHILAQSYGKQYPFIVYVDGLKSDITSLKYKLEGSYHYAERAGYAHQVLNALMWIRDIVIADSAYANELYYMEQARLERMRREEEMRFERERMKMIERQAQAALERAQAYHYLAASKNNTHVNNDVTNVSVNIRPYA